MAGYMSGYLSALQVVSGVENQKQQRQMQQQQYQMQQQQMQENQQERGILREVFQAQDGQRNQLGQLDQADALAQQYKAAGVKLLGVNPRDGMRMIQEGSEMVQRSSAQRLEAARTEKLQGEYLASAAAGVEDQTSLNEFVRTAAKSGKVIPTKYQVWGDETKRYLERAVQAAIPISKQQDLMLRSKEIEMKSQTQQIKQQAELRREKAETSKEARLQEGLAVRKAAATNKATAELGLRGEKEVAGEISILRDFDQAGVFKDAPVGQQRAAAQDVHYRAQKIRANSLLGGDEPVSSEEALDLARREVLGEFKGKAGGTFQKDTAERVKGGVEKAAKGQPTVQEALKALGEPYDPSTYEYKIDGDRVLKRRK